jgi:hypothetical protein
VGFCFLGTQMGSQKFFLEIIHAPVNFHDKMSPRDSEIFGMTGQPQNQ